MDFASYRWQRRCRGLYPDAHRRVIEGISSMTGAGQQLPGHPASLQNAQVTIGGICSGGKPIRAGRRSPAAGG
jgi:hypothetical protein